MGEPTLIEVTKSWGGWSGCTCLRRVAPPPHPGAPEMAKGGGFEVYMVGRATRRTTRGSCHDSFQRRPRARAGSTQAELCGLDRRDFGGLGKLEGAQLPQPSGRSIPLEDAGGKGHRRDAGM